MAIMEQNTDSDVMRVWSLLFELSEQLSQNRNASISLHTVTGGVKTQAIHSQTGFVLRRFNQDKSQEEYNAELERMNAQMSADNLALQNDNKQLSALIKEYEQTLESLMTTFRNRANEVQQRELAIMRDYERKILLRETEELSKTLDCDTAFGASLGRVGQLLRALMRLLGGEDAASLPPMTSTPASPAPTPSGSTLTTPHLQSHIINSLELTENESGEDGEEDDEESADARDTQLAAAEWALERECELARLQMENNLLKHLWAEHEGVVKAAELPPLPSLVKVPPRAKKVLGGKEIGPFGMFKKFLDT